ncbi:STAS domain-containing protein [Metabacillus sp. RGM 3146]|uniref:STAS domain-containing protein n=1 Tax=Metabacillus sp. RGM 3146 TaxID=3401092 RepID=UPI003B9BEFB7
MQTLGSIPGLIDAYEVFTSIDETVLLADLSYNVIWMNPKAITTMNIVAPLYGFKDASSLIGQNMDFFHDYPDKSRRIMKDLSSTHRTKINIKNRFIAETVITPIVDRNGVKKAYLLMLLDITEQHNEQQQKDQLIKELSVPILNIWDSIYAIPIIGELDMERSEYLLKTVLEVSAKNQAEYFLLDVSGVPDLTEDSVETIYKISRSLRLIGTQCYIVGISPRLAKSLAMMDFKGRTFTSVKAAVQYVIESQR